MILTSNGTRELSDALRRRCLYLWIDYPDREKEVEILRRRAPDLGDDLARETVEFVQRLRRVRLSKPPGVAETIDFASALTELGGERLDPEIASDALGALVKDPHDLARLTAEPLDRFFAPAGELDETGEA